MSTTGLARDSFQAAKQADDPREREILSSWQCNGRPLHNGAVTRQRCHPRCNLQHRDFALTPHPERLVALVPKKVKGSRVPADWENGPSGRRSKAPSLPTRTGPCGSTAIQVFTSPRPPSCYSNSERADWFLHTTTPGMTVMVCEYAKCCAENRERRAAWRQSSPLLRRRLRG